MTHAHIFLEPSCMEAMHSETGEEGRCTEGKEAKEECIPNLKTW